MSAMPPHPHNGGCEMNKFNDFVHIE